MYATRLRGNALFLSLTWWCKAACITSRLTATGLHRTQHTWTPQKPCIPPQIHPPLQNKCTPCVHPSKHNVHPGKHQAHPSKDCGLCKPLPRKKGLDSGHHPKKGWAKKGWDATTNTIHAHPKDAHTMSGLYSQFVPFCF